MGNKTAKVAIYIRVSTDIQAEAGDSLAMQRQDLMAYAKLMLNTEDCTIFEDAGYSGKNTDRPQFQEMMRQLRSGSFTHLLVWKIDRISRNLLDFAAMYVELKDLGVVFVSKNEQFDTSTAMGEAMLKIILVFAELERNMTSERVLATMISRASNGQWNGGRIPYGYSYDFHTQEFSINDAEASVVKLIHDKYEQIRSLTILARWLNESGYVTRAGNEWNAVSLDIILNSLFYCGDYVYNRLKEGDRQRPKDSSEWITVQNHHVPIIDREQKNRILSILSTNSKIAREKSVTPMTRHTHVFGGLIFCGQCGRLLNSTPVSLKKESIGISRYTCPRRKYTGTECMNPSVTDIIVGDVVMNYIVNMLAAQREIDSIESTADLEKILLRGEVLSHIKSIDAESLRDIFDTLKSVDQDSPIYGRDVDVHKTKRPETEMQGLLKRKQSVERAIDRLTSLYLYSENVMPESEYIIKRTQLSEQLQDVLDEIGMLNTDAWSSPVSDDEFVQMASEFIISQKLSSRNFVSYRRVASEVSAESIKAFMLSVIDSITVTKGKVSAIVFKNGLSQRFILKN